MLHPFAIIIMNVGIGLAGEAMGGLTWSDGSGWVLGYYGVTECECIFHLSFVGRNDMKLIYAGGVWSWRGFKFEKYGDQIEISSRGVSLSNVEWAFLISVDFRIRKVLFSFGQSR